MTDSDQALASAPLQVAELPSPPLIQRKLQFNRVQLICVPLLMAMPLLALLGVFGESFTTVNTANTQLALEVDYATRFRYKMVNDLQVSITNLSDQSPLTVTVAFDRAYFDQFSNLTFTPSVARITDQAYEIELTDLSMHSTQAIHVELQGERYWHHRGTISASTGSGERAQLQVSTIIWP